MLVRHVGADFNNGWALHEFEVLGHFVYVTKSPDGSVVLDGAVDKETFLCDSYYSFGEIVYALYDSQQYESNGTTELDDYFVEVDLRESGLLLPK